MAPPKKAPAAKENVSLGPLAGDGMSHISELSIHREMTHV